MAVSFVLLALSLLSAVLASEDCIAADKEAEDVVSEFLQRALQIQDSRSRVKRLADTYNLWDGTDHSREGQFSSWETSHQERAQQAHLKWDNLGSGANKTHWLQIAGMFDAGTNLLGATLEENLGATTFKSYCPGRVLT
mmetsp:Transcript_73502/g.129738  ORF Transcript_73502/g.129738 Transcript_73502/m.129738 type:complete len:139 (-) Transcript_73502:786-1202(-)